MLEGANLVFFVRESQASPGRGFLFAPHLLISISTSSMNTKYFQSVASVLSARRIERGIELELAPGNRERLRVEVFRDDVIRLKISRAGSFDESPTFAVCAPLHETRAEFKVEENDQFARVSTARMSLTIYRQPFRIEAHRADGSVIFEGGTDENGHSGAYATLNDEFVVRRKCRREDSFFGLGEKTGRFNRRNRSFTLWNTDIMNPNIGESFSEKPSGDPLRDPTSIAWDPYYISIPFFYHQPNGTDGMAGFFFDNGYRARFEFVDPKEKRKMEQEKEKEYLVHFEGGQYTEYIFAGPAMRDILEAYTWLTGRMAPPPLWALGYHQCRWFAYTQDAVEKLGRTHREKSIPCDVLWLDIDYMDGYRVFTWDQNRFPDHVAMLERFRQQGFRVITIIDPGVKHEPGYPVFDEAVKRDVLCRTEGGEIYVGQVWPGKTAFPDFVTEAGRKWWGELNAGHVRSGLAGIWNDMNEPATGDIPPGAMRFDHGRHAHERYHNQYAMLMAMGTVEGLLEAMPDRRTFVLSRAGFSGIQRYAANWMGDNVSRWDHLWLSLPMALGLGVSGQPFVGADIGGFAGNTTAELLVRWYQCGTLTPFCRNHNAAHQSDQYPWVFGETVEELCRGALQLRYRLLPYIYSQFIRSSETGAPVQIPLVFAYQDDATTRDIDDEYLFGEHLLVAPVYTPGCTARQVYLPKGTWHHWHTGEKFSGGRFILASTPMDQIPLYARGGAVIPMWPGAPASTMGYYPETIELHVFVPGEDGETRSLLQEDDGHTFAAFKHGAFYRTEFVVQRTGLNIFLEANVSGRGFPEFKRKKFVLKFRGAAVTQLGINGTTISIDNEWTLENSGVPFRVEFQAG
jgi:alpha-glucosidase